MPAMRAGYNFLHANENNNAIIVSTEVCSASVFWGDDPELILSNSIFADGSAAAILTNRKGVRGLRIVDVVSKVLPYHREKLRFKIESARLRNVIKPDVPEIAAGLLKDIAQNLFTKNGLEYVFTDRALRAKLHIAE